MYAIPLIAMVNTMTILEATSLPSFSAFGGAIGSLSAVGFGVLAFLKESREVSTCPIEVGTTVTTNQIAYVQDGALGTAWALVGVAVGLAILRHAYAVAVTNLKLSANKRARSLAYILSTKRGRGVLTVLSFTVVLPIVGTILVMQVSLRLFGHSACYKLSSRF